MSKLEKEAQGISETRSSTIRRKTAHITQGLAEVIDKTVPNLSPTHLNILGALLVVGGAVAAVKGKRRLAFTLSSIGSGLDAVDGPLARTKAQKDPNSVNFGKGQIYDALSDRIQEGSGALGRGISAHHRRDKVGELAAFATAITSTLPSIARAAAEVLGKPVPESGKGILGLVGTRVGRAISGIIATTFPEAKGVPLQPAIDTLMSVSNIKTTIDRLKAARKNETTLPLETRAEAKDRLKVLGVFGVLATGASLFTYWRLNRK